ncbi:hypothetical protein KP806_14190 [Paenibacillus sp. N4]|uniref:DUF6933 domain-containing protein n=1 Tax=Paenibacillus vietnamensis TaxID=2590547 RepID=UPI001CD115B1|nr:hypothetical protein [Paenibacillus vietnamensis]MCA0756202.1 hypothetical protein [Paenibacillus vietnamensis]
MIILRLTKNLLKDMKATPIEINNFPSLFSWHVNIYNLNKRKHIVFVNDLTRLSVIIDGIRTGQLERLKDKFLVTLREYLLHEGFKENEINAYLEFGSEIVISKTNSRSVLGTMNEVTFFLEDNFNDNIQRLKWLNRLIHKPIDYYEPINVFREAIKDRKNYQMEGN